MCLYAFDYVQSVAAVREVTGIVRCSTASGRGWRMIFPTRNVRNTKWILCGDLVCVVDIL